MRKLYIKRQRALACFGLAYHAIVGRSQREHVAWAEGQDRAALMQSRGPGSIRNGETICLEIGENASSVFVIAYPEKGLLMTRELPIPPGNEDLLCTVVTDYDGNRRLSLRLVPGDPEA